MPLLWSQILMQYLKRQNLFNGKFGYNTIHVQIPFRKNKNPPKSIPQLKFIEFNGTPRIATNVTEFNEFRRTN